jgi:hypothetical protein
MYTHTYLLRSDVRDFVCVCGGSKLKILKVVGKQPFFPSLFSFWFFATHGIFFFPNAFFCGVWWKNAYLPPPLLRHPSLVPIEIGIQLLLCTGIEE